MMYPRVVYDGLGDDGVDKILNKIYGMRGEKLSEYNLALYESYFRELGQWVTVFAWGTFYYNDDRYDVYLEGDDACEFYKYQLVLTNCGPVNMRDSYVDKTLDLLFRKMDGVELSL